MENLCRLCGIECDYMFDGVFNHYCEDLQIHSKIMEVLHIKVDAEDGLPKKICKNCHHHLGSTTTFMNVCLDTQRRLGNLCDTNKNLPPVEGIERSSHGSNCSILSSSSLPPISIGYAGAEISRLASPANHEPKILENASPALINQTTNNVTGEKSDSNAKGNISSSDSTMNTAAGVEAFNEDCLTSAKNFETYDRSPVAAPKTLKRVRIAQAAKKITVKKKKRIPSNRDSSDGPSGAEISREKKEWVCDTCQMIFVQESLYIEHLNVHSGNRPYGCRLCSHSFRKRQDLNQHIRTAHSEKLYKCTVCNHMAKPRGKLKDSKDGEPEKPFVCDKCTYRIGERGRIQQHVAKGDLSYVCELCGLGFRTCPMLQSHRMNAHFPEPKHCQKCGIRCLSPAKYRAHILHCFKDRDRYASENSDKIRDSKEILKNRSKKRSNVEAYKSAVGGDCFHRRNRSSTNK